MSLVTHFPGDIKSGKTLSAIYWTKRLMSTIGCPVYTNMGSLIYQGQPWGEQIEIDKLLADITETDLSQAYYKLGVLLIDEAHTLWTTEEMRGARGRAMTALIAQAGKRGLIVVFTAHLAGMVAPKVRELTQMIIRCKTPDEGKTVWWNVRDPRAWREAEYDNRPPPADTRLILHNAWRQHAWYDTNEVIDPFAAAKGAGASKASKSFWNQIEAIKNQVDDARPVSEGIRQEFASKADQVKREVVAENQLAPKPKRPVRRHALGGIR
jgi:hypothetical protein